MEEPGRGITMCPSFILVLENFAMSAVPGRVYGCAQMVGVVSGTEESGEAVFQYFLDELSPDGMTECPLTGLGTLVRSDWVSEWDQDQDQDTVPVLTDLLRPLCSLCFHRKESTEDLNLARVV